MKLKRFLHVGMLIVLTSAAGYFWYFDLVHFWLK